jgi:DNA-binding NarL/FixJ family response regulator
MTPSAANERQLAARPEQAGDQTIHVGVALTSERGLVASAIEMLVERTPTLDLLQLHTDCDGRPVPEHGGMAAVLIVDRVSIVARLRAENPSLRVIVLLPANNPDDMLASIRAGASACIDDSTPLDALVDIVSRVWAGEAVFEPSILVELLQRQAVPMVAQPSRTARLSDRELEVLAALARGASPAEVAAEFSISLYTVRTHLKNILVKMGARSKLEAVVVALREGRISLDLPDTGGGSDR